MLQRVVLLLAVFSCSSHQQCFSEDDAVAFVDPEQFNSWVESGHRFSVSLFKLLDSERLNQNIVFSPWSIRGALLMAYFGAEHETATSLAKVLQIPRKQGKSLTWSFYIIQRALNFQNDINSTTLKSANKIFISRHLNVRRCMGEMFQSELELIDYDEDVTWAQTYINEWISNRTDGQITDLIDELTPSTTATLVNAVFYKSKWLTQFNPKRTQHIFFQMTPDKWRSTKMMSKTDMFEHGYSELLRANLLLLPYVDNRTAMILILPDEHLDTVMEALDSVTLGYLSDRSNYQALQVRLAMPKYKHRSRMDLDAVLGKLGIGNALSGSADFSGFTGRKEVFLGEMDHEAVIEVDEEGTTATAATGIGERFSRRKPVTFFCDRPFAYVIYDFALSQVLFMGTFREP